MLKTNKNFDKFEELFVCMYVFRDKPKGFFLISLINMKRLVLSFEGLISNIKEKRNSNRKKHTLLYSILQ